MTRMSRLLCLLGSSFAVLGTPVVAASFQPVSRLACPGGDFVVDARPYGENAAAGSQLEMRYRYRDVELAALSYEGAHASLAPYLRQGSPPVYDFGLRLDTDGAGGYGGDYETGPTLYLPPAVFSGGDAERLAACIAERHAVIRGDLERAVVRSRTVLGLMKTRAQPGIDGIARLVHTDAPIVGLYDGGWYGVLVERGGRVRLHTTYTGRHAGEAVTWGQVEQRPGRRPVLRARRQVVFAGKLRDGEDYLPLTAAHGRRLKDDYAVVLE